MVTNPLLADLVDLVVEEEELTKVVMVQLAMDHLVDIQILMELHILEVVEVVPLQQVVDLLIVVVMVVMVIQLI